MLTLLVVSAGFIWTMGDRGASLGQMLQSLQELKFESLGLGAIAGVLLPLAALLKTIQAFGLSPVSLMNTMTEGMRRGTLAANPGARYQFAQEFADVTRALGDRKMVVFIDDLDRCQPDHVVEVLEVINYLMTSGRCFVILGMDPSYVETCVGLRFEELAEATAGNGNGDNNKVEDRQSFACHYMEKLVNLRVRVPSLDDDKSKRLLAPRSQEEHPPGFWPVVADSLREQGPRVLGIGLFVALVTASWLAGDRLHLWIHLPVPDEGPGELHTTLNSITFLDDQRGFAVGEKGAILLTVDGGKTWRANTGEQVKAPGEEGDGTDAGPVAKTPGGERKPAPPPETPAGAYFEPGQTNAAHWPQVTFPVLAALALLVGLVFVLQRPFVTEKDSPMFLRALEIWYPWIALRRQTPRLLKRFLNEVRYLAMQYRAPLPEITLWERATAMVKRWRGISVQATPATADTGLNEAKIVALSAIYQINSSWVENEATFQEIVAGRNLQELLKEDFPELLGNITGEEHLENLGAVVGQLSKAIEAHRQDPQLGSQFPGIEDRRQFLDACNGIRLRTVRQEVRESGGTLPATVGAAVGRFSVATVVETK